MGNNCMYTRVYTHAYTLRIHFVYVYMYMRIRAYTYSPRLPSADCFVCGLRLRTTPVLGQLLVWKMVVVEMERGGSRGLPMGSLAFLSALLDLDQHSVL